MDLKTPLDALRSLRDVLFTLPALEVEDIRTKEKTFQLVTLPGGGLTGEAGRPALPTLTRFVSVPPRSGAELRVVETARERLEGYDLARPGRVNLAIHDVRGRLVRVLVNWEYRETGPYVFEWGGRDERGREVAAGVYFCRFRTEGVDESRKMALLK